MVPELPPKLIDLFKQSLKRIKSVAHSFYCLSLIPKTAKEMQNEPNLS